MMRPARGLALVLCLTTLSTVLFAAPMAVAQVTTITVTRLDDPAPDGSCAGGDCSLREAVLLANATAGPGSEILLPVGTLTLAQGAGGNDNAASGDLDAFQAITLRGAGRDQTVIDVAVADRAFDAHGVSLTLTDLTISGGGQVDLGGAVRALGATMTIERSTLRGNLAETGGAVFGDQGQVVRLIDSVVESNSAFNGGGIYVRGGSSLVVQGGSLTDNTSSGRGGAIGAEAATSVEVTGAEIARNRAVFGGGLAVTNPEAPANITRVDLRDTDFVQNDAVTAGISVGGGLYIERSTLTAVGLLVDGNTGANGSGGMELAAVDATISDSHLVANDGGTGAGGAIRAFRLTSSALGTVSLDRTLIEGNTATIAGAVTTSGTDLLLTTTTVSGNSAGSIGGIRSRGPLTLTASTIADNRSTGDTAGNLLTEAPVMLVGSVLALAGGVAGGDDVNCVLVGTGSVAGSGNVVDDATCPLPAAGNALDVDAGLEPLQLAGGPRASHGLDAQSPAIDAGAATCPPLDARDVVRPVDGDQDGVAVCDAGAVEHVPAADLVVTLADGPDPVPTGAVLTYTVTVFNNGPSPAVATTLDVTLPVDLQDIAVTTDVGSCQTDAGVDCDLGSLAVGVAGTVRITGSSGTAGTLEAMAVATSRALDPTPEDATATTVTTVGPPGDSRVVRLAGPSRVETAVAVSQDAFMPGSAGAVVLARADLFPDALAGTPLAVAMDAPLLLTQPDSLHPAVAAELQRVLAAGGEVVLLGGEPALSAAVANAVEALGRPTRRLAGPDRFATAVAIARDRGSAPPSLLLADGTNFPDALAAGPAAAAVGGAVLLTAGSQIPPVVAAYLAAEGSAAARFAVGQPAVDADPSATPVVGPSRVETAVAVAERFFPTPTAVGVATGENFPDALAGGAHVGGLGGPILLSTPAALHPAAAAYLSARRAGIAIGYLYGAEPVLSAAVLQGVQGALAP